MNSKILFLEKAVWKSGQEIITVLLPDKNGRKQKVGHIYFEQKNGQKSFTANNSKGQALFSSTIRLYDLKKQFVELEPTLLKNLENKD